MLKQKTRSENGSAAYHGYWGLDFTTVDPHLGTDQDFSTLVTKAHGLDLRSTSTSSSTTRPTSSSSTGTVVHPTPPYRSCSGKKFNPARYVTG